MPITNLTPHKLDIEVASGSIIVIPTTAGSTAGTKLIARCIEQAVPAGEIVLGDETIKLYGTTYGAVELIEVTDDKDMLQVGDAMPFPEPQDGVFYAVSFMVRDRMPKRTDVISPGKAIRTPDGKIIGAKGFSANV